ncbi:MAG: hypothetical protein DRJ45_09320 [Thermoprotei archaeon]|nr:MAG: hypothetical protein DRJ45_09320 [Thermoprotei archaeon]
MVTIIFEEKKNSLDSSLAIELAKKLREVLGDKLIALNTTNGFDGSNVRIIVKNKTFEDNRKIMQVIGEIEEKFDIHGKILPEILGEESVEYLSEESK